jgi:hypothetical protein
MDQTINKEAVASLLFMTPREFAQAMVDSINTQRETYESAWGFEKTELFLARMERIAASDEVIN